MPDENPYPVTNPNADNKEGAVVFVHGFTGRAVDTWTGFPDLVAKDVALGHYDFYFWGYPSALKVKYLLSKYFWEDDPSIETIGRGLRTLLGNMMAGYEKLVLVGHSMGGLVIQAFVLEEIGRHAKEHLDRITEIVLYATPSGGKREARWGSFLKNQLDDMSDLGEFITKLREGWTKRIDDRRADPDRPATFRLTLVAGMKDKFVPEESSLDPFPLDEHEFAPGNHTDVVKPANVGGLPFSILKKRLLRGTPTVEERRLVYGESKEAVDLMNHVRAAIDLEDTKTLLKIAEQLLKEQPTMPAVERALGLHLGRQMQYKEAVALLERCLRFAMTDGTTPFAGDVQAAQQLAVALSALDRNVDALKWLGELPVEAKTHSETMGIRAGRMKREWHKNEKNLRLGRRTLDTYQAAYESARSAQDVDQILYNGINVAYMRFVLEKPHQVIAKAVLTVAAGRKDPDYWTLATRAEAYLLIDEYTEAAHWYETAFDAAPFPRYMATTAEQALDIVRRLGDPQDAKPIEAVIGSAFPLLLEGTAGEDLLPDDE